MRAAGCPARRCAIESPHSTHAWPGCRACPTQEATITTPIKPASWTYAEAFVAEDDVLASARSRAEEVGVTPVSPGRAPRCVSSPPCSTPAR